MYLGAIADKIVNEHLLADYLLYTLNHFNNQEYLHFYQLSSPLDDIHTFLPLAAKRLGVLLKGGELDTLTAAKSFIQFFRQGKFGKFTLDTL